MITIRKTVTVDAPASRIYEFMTSPENLPEIWPSMIEVSNVKRDADGAHSFDWTYKMAGLRFQGRSETTEVVRNDHFVVKNDKGIPSTFRWAFSGENGQCRVTMECQYEIPSKLLEKLARPFVERQNEHEAGVVLQNLKARMELGQSTGKGMDARATPRV